MKQSIIIRRLLCLCLTLFCIITTIGLMPVYSAGITEISFGNVLAKVGEEVTVPVTIENNLGIAAFRFRVSYNTDDLDLTAIEKGNLINKGMFQKKIDSEKGQVTFTWYSENSDVNGDGEIAILKFSVKETAQGDYPLKITYLPEDVLNSEREKVLCHVVDGGISIRKLISGTISSFGDKSDIVTVALIKDGTEIESYASDNGAYKFDYVSPGTYEIKATKKDHATRIYDIVVENSDLVQDISLFLKGDLDENGAINDKDATYLLFHLFFPEEYKINQPVDFNDDGKEDAADVVHLLFYIYFPKFYKLNY